jgi:hypothetical protein
MRRPLSERTNEEKERKKKMRKGSPLVGLTIFALAATARAQTAAPAAPPAGAPPAVPAPAPAPAVVAPPAPVPEAAPAIVVASATPVEPKKKKLHLGLSALAMGLGKYRYTSGSDMVISSDASFAYGLGLSVGYEVIPHLVVGLAPQIIFHVQEKVPEIAGTSPPVQEWDFFARVAYEYEVIAGTELYAEALPGFSMIRNESGPYGFVMGLGAGASIAVSDRAYVNLGAGYQLGFQKWKEGVNTLEASTRYVRVALGGGEKF